MINQLSEGIGLSQDLELLGAVLEELIKYSEEHLSYEEKLLEEISYPELEQHKALHWAYLEKVSNLSVESFKDQEHARETIISFLQEWWQHHILIEDKAYSTFIS